MVWEFPGSPVVSTQCFNSRGPSSIPGQGTKILKDVWHGQKKKKKNFYASKDILKRVEKQYTEWKKISANHRSEKEFAPRICFENVYTDTKARHCKTITNMNGFLKIVFLMIDNCILPIISTVNTR